MKHFLLIFGFAVAMAFGAQVEVPLGPVPFVLSDLVVLLAGLVLGPVRGALAVALYVFAGAVGLPVYAGGGAGIEHLFGPTGGFLFGFVAAALVAGLISHRGRFNLVRDAAATFSGQITFFTLGLVWLKLQTEMDWATTLDKGLLPFLFPILVKLISATSIAFLWRRFKLPR